MRSLSVQVQPDRSPGLDIRQLTATFEKIANQGSLVKHHEFDGDDEDGAYFNFTFETERAAELWRQIQASIYESAEYGVRTKCASIAVCSSEEGWDDYLLLFHFDATVEVDDVTSL